MKRQTKLKRTTEETNIDINLNLDGIGDYKINTGIGFFDHMLNLFSRHGLFDIEITAIGDLHIDTHHTVEDVGIVLGKAIFNCLKDKKSIKRYGNSFVPMDESLAMCSVDIGGRPYLVFNAELGTGKVGDMDLEMVEEFFRAVAFNAEINIHVNLQYGKNAHHKVESIFKAFGRALREAVEIDKRIIGVMSTKGVI